MPLTTLGWAVMILASMKGLLAEMVGVSGELLERGQRGLNALALAFGDHGMTALLKD